MSTPYDYNTESSLKWSERTGVPFDENEMSAISFSSEALIGAENAEKLAKKIKESLGHYVGSFPRRLEYKEKDLRLVRWLAKKEWPLRDVVAKAHLLAYIARARKEATEQRRVGELIFAKLPKWIADYGLGAWAFYNQLRRESFPMTITEAFALGRVLREKGFLDVSTASPRNITQEQAERLFAEIMGQKLYRYAAQNRPPGYATVPSGYIRVEDSTHPVARHGLVVYDRPLTADEVYSFELVPVVSLAELVDAGVARLRKHEAAYLEYWRKGDTGVVEGGLADVLKGRIALEVTDRKAFARLVMAKIEGQNPRQLRERAEDDEEAAYRERSKRERAASRYDEDVSS